MTHADVISCTSDFPNQTASCRSELDSALRSSAYVANSGVPQDGMSRAPRNPARRPCSCITA